MAYRRKHRITSELRSFAQGMLFAGKSQREVAEELRMSRNSVAALAKGLTRRSDMDVSRRRAAHNKTKRSSPINALRREIKRLVEMREIKVYHTGKKRKRMERVTVPFGTAPRIRQRLFQLQNQRLDAMKKLPKKDREKKANAEFTIPSVRAIQKHLNALGLKSRTRPRVPFTKENRSRRLAFAQKPEHRDMEYCKRIFFSDEHVINGNDNSCKFQWVGNPKKDLVPRESKSKHNTVNSHLWGMIGYNFKSPLIWIDFKEKNEAAKKRKERQLEKKKKKTTKPKTSTQKKKKAKKATTPKKKTLKRQQIDDPTRLTAATYIKYVLSNQLIKRKLKEDGVIFMQDGAPAHNSAQTKAFLRKNRITFIDDWPSHSPDMNPIEQVWAELNRRISENQRNVPSSVEELRRMAEEEWDAIPMSLINSYVLSFHSKCARVVKNKGGTAKR